MKFLGLRGKRYIVVFLLASIVSCFINIYAWLDMPATGSNLTVSTLHFKALRANTTSRGNLNYDLYVKENDNHYKIAASYAGCFNYNTFVAKVLAGDIITLTTLKKNGFLSSGIVVVVSVKGNNVEYLNISCAKEQFEGDLRTVPYFTLIFLVVLYFTLYARDQKNHKRQVSRKHSAKL